MRILPALAAEWKFTPSVGLRATLSDNVRASTSGDKSPDFYMTVIPRIAASREGARLKVNFYYQPYATVYASNADQNVWANTLGALANLEAVPDFFFVDATANIAQTFLSPFAPLPTDIGTVTNNRTETYGASISPYIKGRLGAQTNYELRYRYVYTTSASSLTHSSSLMSWSGNIAGRLTERSTWAADAYRSETQYGGNPAFTNSIGRAYYTYQLNADLSATLRGGYEETNYAVADRSGPIYGGGVNWRPTSRTNVDGFVEKRFFGTGYGLTANHRRRLSALSVNASRDISSYPALLFTLPPGDTRSLLDAALTARIPDPALRETAIDQFLTQTGSPETLSAFTSYYSEQINLVERVSASFALLGVRNSVIFSASWWKSEPFATVSGQPLPPGIAPLNRFTTYGGAINWNYKLTGKSQLASTLSSYYTQSLDNKDLTSTNSVARIQLNTALTPKTTAGIGARATRFTSTFGSDYTEHAIFAVANHQF
jgi:uncharacterized protein (PEP-CTERM system associated)